MPREKMPRVAAGNCRAPGGPIDDGRPYLCGRGLARTVWPDQAVDAAFAHVEGEPVERQRAAELLGQTGGGDDIHGVLLVLSPSSSAQCCSRAVVTSSRPRPSFF